MEQDEIWESNGVKFKSVKVGSHWYSMRIAEPKPMPRVGAIAVWLVSGRWRCECGSRHRRYVRACGCGGRAPAEPSGI